MAAKVNLLIVDNDPSIRYSLSEIFRCMGHSVRTAEDGFYALQEMAAATPDILLSDLNMPRMSGFELLSVVRRRYPSVYVVAMSGVNLRGGIPHDIAADGFYEKASGMVALLQAVTGGISPNRIATSASRKATPIWVPHSPVPGEGSSAEWQGEGGSSAPKRVFIGCPECLRAFPQQSHTSGSPQETTCSHCRAPINFAVVEQCASAM